MELTRAVVIGSGHNGLVAACYLAQAGMSVTVLERRDIIGGATITEEIIPGYRISTASYSLSLLRPDVSRDLDLARHGLVIQPKEPQMFVPLPDGRSFFIWRDAARTKDELARIYPGDADAYSRWGAFWEEAVALLRPFAEDPDPPPLSGIEAFLRDQGREDVWRLALAGSAADTVREFFEAEEIQGAFVGQGIIGVSEGPEDPGTAWVMAYHALGGELNGITGTWAYVRGGMGSVSASIAAAARERGVEIITGAPVLSVAVEHGRARGVVLEDGHTIDADVVLSNAGPDVTFGSLVPAESLPAEFMERVRGWRYDGAVVKVNLALSELPDFTAMPGAGDQQRGTVELSPSVAALQRAREEARGTHPSSRPYMEVFIQSATDDTLAPPGHHVLSAFAQYAPDDCSDWETQRIVARNAVVDTIASYAPNVPGSIIAEDVLGPPELEARLGLTGGDIFHGSIVPEQCFGDRFGYRTPIEGLYLCGAGARPGGGVMGAAGRNAARVVLEDGTAREAVPSKKQ